MVLFKGTTRPWKDLRPLELLKLANFATEHSLLFLGRILIIRCYILVPNQLVLISTVQLKGTMMTNSQSLDPDYANIFTATLLFRLLLESIKIIRGPF